MKKIILVLSISAIFLSAGMVLAQGDNKDSKIDNRPLEKITVIHYKKDFAKPAPACGNGRCEKGENVYNCPADCGGQTEPALACYGFISKGAKIKQPANLVIGSGIDGGAVWDAAKTWDSNTSAVLFGNFATASDANWDDILPDGRNEISMGNYSQQGVIAITNIWGYFGGPVGKREIVEFDVMFDSDFAWGNADANPSIMDWQNIAVHELGHGLGLDDMYQSGCSQVTMYGYSGYGETSKRSLEAPDISGLHVLYGN